MMHAPDRGEIWQILRAEAVQRSAEEPLLASHFHSNVLAHPSIERALCAVLAERLGNDMLPAMLLHEVFEEAMAADAGIRTAVCADLVAHRTRDPACDSYLAPFLHFKGFHALQAHRMAHWLWVRGRHWLAFLLQNRVSSRFAIDIHPGASIGSGIMIDHGTGIVIGETARIDDDVSMLHGVTLGGSGCAGGDRHPKVESGVLFGAGAAVLGPVRIGAGAKIGAGSLVLTDVPPHVTVAGVPARIVGRPTADQPALEMDQGFGAAPEEAAGA
jgi:serine O-acetyltransferase